MLNTKQQQKCEILQQMKLAALKAQIAEIENKNKLLRQKMAVYAD